MAASYNNRPPGSRSGSVEAVDQPPSYVNRAYAPTGAPATAAAAAAEPAAAGQVPLALAYGRRYQPHVTTSTSGQRLYSEQAARGQPLEPAYGGSSQQPGLYGEQQRSTTPVNGSRQPTPRSQSPGRYLDEGSSSGRGSAQPPLYGNPTAPRSYYGQLVPGGRAAAVAAANSGFHGEPAEQPRAGRLYSQKPYFPGYNSGRYGRPKHMSVTREPGYYNLNTDTVVRAKKHRNKTFLYVGRPWTKGFSTTPRDFLPLAVMATFFSPPLGVVAIVFSLLSRHSSMKEDYGAAGHRGRIAFWISVSAVIVGIVCWIVIVAAINGFRFIGHRIH